MPNLVIQLNIPFCQKHCSYCAQQICKYELPVMQAYVDAMIREMEAASDDFEEYEVTAVSVEGGSPVLAEPSGLQKLFTALHSLFHLASNVQISLQTMPGDYSRALMQRMPECGVNHWIFGVETADPNEHALLERPYVFDTLSMVDVALRTFPVRDRSIELLYGIPGQTMHSFEHSLNAVLSYDPEHVTLLPLQIQKGTKLYGECLNQLAAPVTKEKRESFYHFGRERLEQSGYHAYTIWDFAKPGCENRYRLAQLHGTEQLGIGYGASSLQNGVTYTSGHSLQEYLDHAEDLSITANHLARLDEEALAQRNEYLKHFLI